MLDAHLFPCYDTSDVFEVLPHHAVSGPWVGDETDRHLLLSVLSRVTRCEAENSVLLFLILCDILTPEEC